MKQRSKLIELGATCLLLAVAIKLGVLLWEATQ